MSEDEFLPSALVLWVDLFKSIKLEQKNFEILFVFSLGTFYLFATGGVEEVSSSQGHTDTDTLLDSVHSTISHGYIALTSEPASSAVTVVLLGTSLKLYE